MDALVAMPQSGNGSAIPQDHNLNVFSQSPNAPFESPSFLPQQSSTPVFQQHRSLHIPNGLLEKINHTVAKARSDLLAAGESITTRKVSQSALSSLKVDTWESLGFRLQEVPVLDRLLRIEGQVNSFIHCFVAVQRITSLHDLEVAICEHERVAKFEDLELGPLFRHPLVLHYFSVCSEMTEVFKITCGEIIDFLRQFMDICETRSFRVQAFLDFISEKLSVKKREFLGLRFLKFRKCISDIRRAMKLEDRGFKKISKSRKAKSGSKRRKRRPIFPLQKQQCGTRSSTITWRVDPFSSCHKNCRGKHMRFVSSGAEGENACGCMSKSGKSDKGNEVEFSLQNNRNGKHASICPYPSLIEEKLQLAVKGEVQGLHSPAGSLLSNKRGQQSRKKRKSINFSCDNSRPHKLHKKNNREADIFSTFNLNDTDGVNDMQSDNYKMPDDAYRTFISTWKDECRSNPAEEIVSREASYYGLEDCSFKVSFLNWALPYAQRYMYCVHPDKYAQLKQTGFDALNLLQVLAVDKLSYRNVIKSCRCASERRVECSCLLQGNILNVTKESDSHALFMELSRQLFDGSSELHLANFLHMITTMKESGSTVEQIEFFISNAQKVTQLPDKEPMWAISAVSSNDAGHEGISVIADVFDPTTTCKDWTNEDNVVTTSAGLAMADPENLEDHNGPSSHFGHDYHSRPIIQRDQLLLGTSNRTQTFQTGRIGESLAYKYFIKSIGYKMVRWVNEIKESGLPYDIVVGDEACGMEYIEVKSTRIWKKEWFYMSLREWQFAEEKGESFSIAHVALSDTNMARISMFKNPVKLCELKNLRLALIVPNEDY